MQRVERRRVEPSKSGGEEAHRRGRENRPHVERHLAGELTGLVQCSGHHIAERDEGDRGRHHEEGDLSEAVLQAGAEMRCPLGIGAGRTRHLGQLRRGNRHPEQTDRERVEHLSIRYGGHRSGREQARDHGVHVGADLDHATPDEHRHEGADDGPHRLRQQSAGMQAAQQSQDGRQLDAELEQAAHDRAPGGDLREPILP